MKSARFKPNPDAVVADLVTRNMGLVYYFVRPYLHRTRTVHDDPDDVIEAGKVGLVEAARRFDKNNGAKFSTYAQHWIHRMIRLHVGRNVGLVRVTSYGYKRGAHAAPCFSIDSAAEDAAQDSGNARWNALIMDALTSLATHPEDRALERRDLVTKLLKSLTSQQRRVVKLRFGLDDASGGRTLIAVGRRMGLSRERVRQIERDALVVMRGALGITPRIKHRFQERSEVA